MMRIFHEVLILVPKAEFAQRVPQIERLLHIAGWMNCNSNVLIYGESGPDLSEDLFSALAKSAGSGSLSIHGCRGDVSSQARILIESLNVELLMLNTTPEERIALSRPEREILRATEIPALLVPKNMAGDGIPRSLLIPISGERRTNRALDLGIRIANLKGLPLDLLHVARDDGTCNCEELVLERYGDQFHYEYPQMIDEIVAKASPFSTTLERKCVRDFKHVHGELGFQILSAMESSPNAWLVLDWGGSMDPGRAHIIKRELRRYRYPILLVHSARKQPFHLKVGSEIDAA